MTVATAPEMFASLPQVQIRTMTEADVPCVAALERASYPFPWSEGIFRDCVRVGYACRVVTLDTGIIAYAVMSLGAGEAHILNICVGDLFRYRGLGRQLLNYLLEQAAASGAGDAFLEVRPTNTTAIRLYQSMGFGQVGVRKGYYQAVGGREDAAVFKLGLRARQLER